MCQMYAIFEEVVGPQPSVSFTKDLPDTTGDDQGIVLDSNENLSAIDQDSQERASQYGSAKARTKRSPSKHHRLHGHKNSTLPRCNNRRRVHSSSDTENPSTTSSSNPLLDTISVLAYDPPDDSDDCYDLTGDVCDHPEEKPTKGTDGDRDSIGYAGSSSIDSGYKSFCPTPEIPDPSFYGSDRIQPLPGIYADSTMGRGGKPRIMMGTKVISRQGPSSPTSTRDSSVSRRSDASLYDVNLDHLMYLRQSLLSAIQKCESSKVETGGNPRKDCSFGKTNSCTGDHSCIEYSPAKNPKTVRFNTDVKVSTVHTSQPPSEGVENSRTGDTASEHGGKVQSKSILKDPLCANLRSQLEAGSGDCTLEEEIDSLLYGRAEFYDLESVDDFPCSYVTMIEEKYRSGKPSLAKVRKLKGGKNPDQTSKSGSQVEIENDSSKVVPEEDSRASKTSEEGSPTVSISKTAKCRFTEVARCMLEIIEDLQMKKMQPENTKSDPAAESTETTNLKEEDVKDCPSVSSKSEFYTSASEYHVYEEIAYDFVGNASIPKLPEVPPPLPARPSNMFSPKPEQQKGRVPSPPPRKSRCLKKTDIEVRNRPKQRSNLYSLFADRAERRNISRSLEREFRVSGNDTQEDDYGFRKKKESSSI